MTPDRHRQHRNDDQKRRQAAVIVGGHGRDPVPVRHHHEQHGDADRDAAAERHEQQTHQKAADDHSQTVRVLIQSVIAMARSASRSRALSFSVALLSWPQAARMSRPRGVRTGEA